MHIKRKEFIQLGSLATASLMVPKFLKAFENQSMVLPGNKVVVILQLSGGNDGLNTVIPVRNDLYYKARPKLGIAKDKALSVTDEVSLHPALSGFKELYDDGSLAILNNVGYPNPDRSHFRSMDIWHTASQSTEYWTNGWVGRYLDSQCKGCDKPTQAIELDDVLSLALKGEDIKGIAVKDPRRLYGTANEKFFREVMKNHKDEAGEQPVDYLYKTMAETLSSADYIFKQSRMHPTNAEYPKTDLGNSLKTIASLIYSEINTKVYYVSLGSFDTHINQDAQQQRLFTEMNDAVKAFVKDLKQQHRFEDVMLFTFSEFGRRVNQNASNGTDHGTANNMFLVSGGLKQKGMLNAMPDLADLNEGDLKHNVDFKNVYATILNKWLKADDKSILTKQYDYMNFI
ncbi:twin-arginine translocation pathway signal [Chitinophagaceae bacterium IBVUCB2]|nr:twin-arginine translocation pathway signal [Chitinophagaceae bacterium IBVUCB2]